MAIIRKVIGSYPDGTVVRDQIEAHSTDPTVGLRYQPTGGLTLRASWGTGFLPPGVNQLVGDAPFTFPSGVWADPKRGNTPTPEYLQITGDNPGLTPEQSESWSAGVILEPMLLPGLRLSVDYTLSKRQTTLFTIYRRSNYCRTRTCFLDV